MENFEGKQNRRADKGAEMAWREGIAPNPLTKGGEGIPGISLESDEDVKSQIAALEEEKVKFADLAAEASAAKNTEEHERLLAEIRNCDIKIAELEKRLPGGGLQ
jgi:hypothetical protein